MDNRERLARQWAESRQQFDNRSERERAAAEYILEHTAPPTMADVEWDDEKYYLAGANVTETCSVVMVRKDSDAQVWVIDPEDQECTWFYAKELTPNGKRYELREVGATVSSNENVGVDQPDHPEVLTTVGDYENAPEGTIISRPAGLPWVKDGGLWRSLICRESSEDLAAFWPPPFNVLRWGDEA